MGSSTIKLQSVVDNIAAQGVPDPRNSAGGYGMQLVLDLADDTIGDLLTQRFNWKFNSAIAPPFLTNSWQQDYPQLGNTDMGWLEDADRIDINNTSLPKPTRQLTVRRQLSRSSYTAGPISQLCWMYNGDMDYGVWPGAGVTYYPLLGTNPSAKNPIMSMVDANGNLLIVTAFGVTGNAAPELPANSIEGTTVVDGTVTWTVVSPISKGFRVNTLPGATGPIWRVVPKYQKTPPSFATIAQTLDPFPNDYARHFRKVYRCYCLKASPNPADRQQGEQERLDYLMALDTIKKQGDNESDAYGMYPVDSVVEHIYPYVRNPQDPSQPY